MVKTSDSARVDGLLRLVVGALLLLTGVWFVLLAIGLIAGVLWMLIDVVLQMIYGEDGWPASLNSVSNLLARIFYWPFDQLQWILFGTRDFPILP